MLLIICFLQIIHLCQVVTGNNIHNTSHQHSPHHSHHHPKPDVCIISRMNNIASLLPQWIDYHHYLGVQLFLIADDCSDDVDDESFEVFTYPEDADRRISRTLLWMRVYEELGIVKVYEKLPFNVCPLHKNVDRKPKEPQLLTYLTQQAKEAGCKYISALDVDEYISSMHDLPQHGSFHKFFLDKLDIPYAIRMPWAMMSSEYRENKTYDKLMIDSFFTGFWDVSHHVKSFAHHSIIMEWENPHYPNYLRNVPGVDNRVLDSLQYPFYLEEEYFFNITANQTEKKNNWAPISNEFEDKSNKTHCVLPTTPWFVRHYYLKSWEEYVYYRVKPKYNAGATMTVYHKSSNTRGVWVKCGHSDTLCQLPNHQFITIMNHTLHGIIHHHVETLLQDDRLHRFIDRLHHLYCIKPGAPLPTNTTLLLTKYLTDEQRNASITKEQFIRGSRFFQFSCH